MSQSTELKLTIGPASFEVTLGSRALADAVGLYVFHKPLKLSLKEIQHRVRHESWKDTVPYVYRRIIEDLLHDLECDVNEFDLDDSLLQAVAMYITRRD